MNLFTKQKQTQNLWLENELMVTRGEGGGGGDGQTGSLGLTCTHYYI